MYTPMYTLEAGTFIVLDKIIQRADLISGKIHIIYKLYKVIKVYISGIYATVTHIAIVVYCIQ